MLRVYRRGFRKLEGGWSGALGFCGVLCGGLQVGGVGRFLGGKVVKMARRHG